MFTLTEPLATKRLVIRPFREADVDDVVVMESDPEVIRYLYWEERGREEVLAATRERMRLVSLQRDDDVVVLAVERREDARVIGAMSLWLRSVEHAQGEFGFVFAADCHGKGYARESSEAVLSLAFTQLDLHRVYARTDARNDPSAALMRRLGMRQEAHFVHNERFKGQWGDELVFAVLAEEWYARNDSEPAP